MGQTLSEKILSQHAGRPVGAGDLVLVDVDASMASDTTAPLAMRAFTEMGGAQVHDPGSASTAATVVVGSRSK